MMTTELQGIRNVFRGLETLYQTYLPKVDPALIHGLLVHEQEKAERAPFYMVEVFTKEVNLIHNGVRIISGILVDLFLQYMTAVLTMQLI